MTSLPARDLGTVKLAELFAEPGCPLCHHRDRAVVRYIEGFMYESVNDVAFRASLDVARGFCGPHTTDVLTGGRHVSGGMVGSAILFGAVMRVRERELRAVRAAGGLSRGRRAQEALRPPACLVCAEAATVDDAAVASLMRLATEPAWAAVIGDAPFCLEHLAALMAAPGRSPVWVAHRGPAAGPDRSAQGAGRGVRTQREPRPATPDDRGANGCAGAGGRVPGRDTGVTRGRLDRGDDPRPGGPACGRRPRGRPPR